MQGPMAKGDSSGLALNLIALRPGSHSTFCNWTAYCFRPLCDLYPQLLRHPNFSPCSASCDIVVAASIFLDFDVFSTIGITVQDPQRTKEHVDWVYRGDYIVVSLARNGLRVGELEAGSLA
jgi:hypothetical protein